MALFQPQGSAEEDSYSVLPELASKLVLYYNAKVGVYIISYTYIVQDFCGDIFVDTE